MPDKNLRNAELFSPVFTEFFMHKSCNSLGTQTESITKFYNKLMNRSLKMSRILIFTQFPVLASYKSMAFGRATR